MNDFVAYRSVTNNLRDVQRSIDAHADQLWVATPKYHGANGQVHMVRTGEAAPAADGEPAPGGISVKHASRRRYLSEQESHFHGFQKLAGDMNFERLFTVYPEASAIRVFGEVYGGAYPHPDVAPLEGVRAVQKGVYYSPKICYIVFDIRIDDEFLSWEDTKATCKRLDLPFVDVAPDCEPCTFVKIYEWAHEHLEEPVCGIDPTLPKISGNVAEGFVIRPVKRAGPRIKVKGKTFAEVTSQKASKKVSAETLQRRSRVAVLAAQFMPSARVQALFSKHTADEIQPRHTKALAVELFEDAVKDMKELAHSADESKDEPEEGSPEHGALEFQALMATPSGPKQLTSQACKIVSAAIKEYQLDMAKAKFSRMCL